MIKVTYLFSDDIGMEVLLQIFFINYADYLNKLPTVVICLIKFTYTIQFNATIYIKIIKNIIIIIKFIFYSLPCNCLLLSAFI